MSDDVPAFYGIKESNLAAEGMWSREMFPKAFSVALVNYMGGQGIDLNTVSADRLDCRVGEIGVNELYGGTGLGTDKLVFDFDTVYAPHAAIADAVPESDLVVTGRDGVPLRRLDMQASVVPDASTNGLAPELMGPELTVRTPSLVNCALSMATSLMDDREDALRILCEDIPENLDWRIWDSVRDYVPTVIDSILGLEAEFIDRQSPFMLQSIWRSEDGGPLMAEHALDAFVWTDYAFTRLFLGSTRRPSDGGPSRPARCAVRLHMMLTDLLAERRPDMDALVLATRYGVSGNKEFMVSGKATNRLMACDRLAMPAVPSSDVPKLATEGFESMIVPERRLDASVYYAARAMHG